MKQIWELWPELTFTAETGTTYIQTPDEKWADYFSIWRRAIREDVDTTCPCPMPQGHLMFDNVKAEPKKEQKQRELF